MYKYKAQANNLYLEGKKILKDKILFTGPVNNVNKYLQASDIFLFNSKQEGLPNSLLEAMACGLPVITTIMNGAAEIIEGGKNGYVMKDYQSPYELADKISAIISSGLTKKMGRHAFETAKKFTNEMNAKRVETLYKKIVQ